VIVQSHEFKGFTLKFLYQVFTGDFINLKRKEKVEKSVLKNDTSSYLDYLKYSDTRQWCSIHEIYEAEKRDKRAKCVRAKGNGTLYLMNGLNDVMQLLAPSGGGTKSENPGNCVVILFYTKFCPGCQALVPHWNSLARNFVDIKVGALDALEYPGLNTDFGIIGLPSIVLFHQGRMIHKFNTTQQATVTNIQNWIQTHTNLKPATVNVVVTSEDFSPTSPLKVTMLEESFDIYLLLSWLFIISCATYYFSKSRTYQQIVEMINRAWRESNEAQLQ